MPDEKTLEAAKKMMLALAGLNVICYMEKGSYRNYFVKGRYPFRIFCITKGFEMEGGDISYEYTF